MAWRAHEMLIKADVIMAAVTAVLGLVQILQPSSTSTAACWIVLGWPALSLPLHILMTDISGFFFSLPWLWLDVLSLALGVADLELGQSLGYLLAALLRLLTAYRRFSGADNGAADNGAADNGAADNGAADNGAADNGARPRRMDPQQQLAYQPPAPAPAPVPQFQPPAPAPMFATPELRRLLHRRLGITHCLDLARDDARDLRNFFRDSGRETLNGITSAELQHLLAQLPDRLRRQLHSRSVPLLQWLGDMLVEVEGTVIIDKLLDAFIAETLFAIKFRSPPTRRQFKKGLETATEDIDLFGFSLQLIQKCVDEVEADESSDRFSQKALLLGLLKFQHRLQKPFVVTCEVVDNKLLVTNVAGDTHVLSQQYQSDFWTPPSKAMVQTKVKNLFALEEGRRLKFLVGHEEVDIAQLASSLLRKQSGRAA
eukprot:TRINITY_DN10185_c0_g1_i1.p1 TRINITY_DN10185_c0_g1~~TRINITY_DN10185_c0_g1_i1.p1  ORF type:complete len:428 (-),score=61.78 TRINITY_DN10185_c0_g1_i1:141-1424(-)